MSQKVVEWLVINNLELVLDNLVEKQKVKDNTKGNEPYWC